MQGGPISIQPDNLLTLQEYLKNHIPYSLKVYGILRSALEKNYYKVRCWVDKWPDPGAVVVKSVIIGSKKRDTITKNEFRCFVIDNSALEKILMAADVVDWSLMNVFAGFPEDAWAILQKTADKYGSKQLMDSKPYLMMMVTSDDLLKLETPDGLTFMPLTVDMAETVTMEWEHSQASTLQYIQSLIQTYPSAHLVNREGQTIGYEIVQPYWSLGMLHVKPEFRGHGYGCLIASHLADMLLQAGSVPFVFVDIDNITSIRLHEKLGFSVLPKRFGWPIYLPLGKCSGKKANYSCM